MSDYPQNFGSWSQSDRDDWFATQDRPHHEHKNRRWLRLASTNDGASSGPTVPNDTVGEDETALVDGIEKRVTTLKSLNERYAVLEAPGKPSVYVSRPDFLPIQDIDLKRRLANEVVITGTNAGRPIYKPAFTVWNGNARRHVYRRVVFTSKPVAADTYNLFRGLGVKPKPGKCGLILQHIEDVICSGDKDAANAIIKLMAWQVQNIGQPSRVAVVMMNENQQAGKGIIFEEILATIYGPSGIVPPTMDQIIGRFNDTIRGCAFAFLDEVLFSGDRRAADALKKLITTSTHGIETKGLPIINCPVAVNLWLASNHTNAAHIEEGDARYWVLKVSEHRRGDHAYFAALMKEIKTGGREAFAHHLLSLDVSDFVPWRDIKKDNQAKRDMIVESVNPYDARKWLKDCCVTESLLGRKAADGGWVPWVAGDEYVFAALSSAYVEWQKTVRSRAAPLPTHAASLGKVLTNAGFGTRRTGANNMRVLPPAETALSGMWND